MGEVLKKFGRYFLLDHIAQGGMAEIYRARLASADGAGRLIVIKRIQAGYGANSEFLQMFKSEIKVTMGFNHPNIVQLYDFGEEANQPYIAMEMVDGKNLKQFVSRANELKQPFPIELAVFIIEQAASGLHYAHSFRDKISGAPLNIVHRDISPQNILISYEGNVKVIDFGIAKATTNIEATRAGVIKGKPSYLSPEQISGEVLDGRSDMFALGAVLWECLTGKKLFAGDSDLAVLKLIESAQTHVKPPSTLNPKIPKELDYLVLRTLAKQRDKRFQTAEELQRALHKFLYSYAPEFNPSDLAYYAKELFKNEIVEDRKQIQKLNDKVEQILSLETHEAPTPSLDFGGSGGRSEGQREEDTTVIEKRSNVGAGAREILANGPSADEKIEIEARPVSTKPVAPAPGYRPSPSSATVSNAAGSLKSTAPRQRPVSASQASPSKAAMGFYPIAAIVLLAGISVFGPEFGVKIPFLSDMLSEVFSSDEARIILQGDQKGVTVAINGQTVANSLPATLRGLKVGTPYRVTVTGAAGSFQEELSLKKGEQKSIAVQLTGGTAAAVNELAASDKGILLRINVTPAGGNLKISINGNSLDVSNPNIRVPLDSPLELSIDRLGFKPLRREFVLESRQVGALKEYPIEIQLEPIHFGYLTIHTTPSADVTIMVDGSPWKHKTPIENEKFPIGTYTIQLSNEVLGMEKNVTATVEEGKLVTIDTRLEIKN